MTDESEIPDPTEVTSPPEGEKPSWTKWKDKITDTREMAAQKREGLTAARRELAATVRRSTDEVAGTTARLVKAPVTTTLDALAASRESRLRTDEENKKGLFW
ncbi:MAG: hypothetical protein UZ21_OP11001000444 [Microgenomates bacterium OLB22]|nr:MAG: hypothetical protein UZ21_OP11001000444 [Microgenomates bacterium OLB22]